MREEWMTNYNVEERFPPKLPVLSGESADYGAGLARELFTLNVAPSQAPSNIVDKGVITSNFFGMIFLWMIAIYHI